jgi:formamidopyrimidine-DNA glycosylase
MGRELTLVVLMPELPEVETVMRGLAGAIQGLRIERVLVRRGDLRHAMPEKFGATLTGARIEGFRRRAKYLLMRLDNGWSVLWHLGMSGRMLIGPATNQPHEHVVLDFNNGKRLGFIDPRRFGAIDLVATAEEDRHPLLARLGPEPLSAALTGKFLRDALAGKRTSIKAALLDQNLIAGLGNIYVCEALYRARIKPTRICSDLTSRDATRLAAAIKETLEDAIKAGGSSLRDYVQATGELGYFQHHWCVYGKEGEPCPECAGAPCPGVQRIVQGGRSSFFCAIKQK